MNETEEYAVFDIKDIIKLIKRHIIMLLIIPVIFAIIGAFISFYYINPIFEASTTIIVRQNKMDGEEISKTDVDLSKSLIYTYAEMAKSYTVLNNTKITLNLEKIDKDSILISPIKDTQILKIEVKNENAKLAMDIANTLVKEFTLEIIRITKTDNVAIVDYAILPEIPVEPNKIMYTFIAGMLGEMIILLIIFSREYLDNTIKTEKDIEKYLKTPVVSTIPNFSQGGKVGYEYGKVYGEIPSVVNNSGSI